MDLSLSGPVFCSCSILFLDFLDHVFVVTETLAILRVFCHTASQAVQVKVCRAIGSQTRTYTTFFPRLKVKKSGRVYLHNITECAEPSSLKLKLYIDSDRTFDCLCCKNYQIMHFQEEEYIQADWCYMSLHLYSIVFECMSIL